MKSRLKAAWFRLLGKDPEAVVVSFWSGPDTLAARMVEEIRRLEPGRRHFVVSTEAREVSGAVVIQAANLRELRRAFRSLRIGLAPVLFTADPHPLRRAAFLLAPFRILAFNTRLERYHLRLECWMASWLFLRGVPFDRIFLRPWSRSLNGGETRVIEGRAPSPLRRTVGILTPYFPFPLSHGGAVRMFHLIRETARNFDILLFSFTENQSEDDYKRLLPFCSKVVLVEKPLYRKPRWSTLRPPEVAEFTCPAMRRALREHPVDLLQVEYTQLAGYGGGILVEHDITFDLYAQMHARERRLSSWWDYFRWRRFEQRVVKRFRRVVVMSSKDAELLGGAVGEAAIRVIENGADFDRPTPEAEPPGMNLLFVGSFRHFPNLSAFRFFVSEVWPELRARFPEMTFTAVGGPEHERYLREAALDVSQDSRIRIHGFVGDMLPFYEEANLVVVPTTVSAGTNLKVLEAIAMQRAVVSTSCGCAGLGLEAGITVMIADASEAFCDAVVRLAEDRGARLKMAHAARQYARDRFGWTRLGEKQRALYRELESGTTIE